MKKNSLLRCAFLGFILCCVFRSEAQYKSLFGQNTTSWQVKTEQLFGAVTDSTVYVKDTLVDGIDFRLCSAFREGSFMQSVLVHEDMLTGYAYFRILNQNTDYLIYDLSLALNDQLVYNGQNITVDSVYVVAGRKYIRFNYEINFIDHLPLIWIEGVGANVGLLYHDQAAISNMNPVLICQHQDEGVNWTTDLPAYSGMCRSGIGAIPQSSTPDLIRIYPQPASQTLYFHFPDDVKVEFIGLYDLFGRSLPVDTFNDNSLNASDLPPGHYLLLLDVNGHPVVKKVVVG